MLNYVDLKTAREKFLDTIHSNYIKLHPNEESTKKESGFFHSVKEGCPVTVDDLMNDNIFFGESSDGKKHSTEKLASFLEKMKCAESTEDLIRCVPEYRNVVKDIFITNNLSTVLDKAVLDCVLIDSQPLSEMTITKKQGVEEVAQSIYDGLSSTKNKGQESESVQSFLPSSSYLTM